MAVPDNIKAISKIIFKRNTAWIFLFLPALFYYIGTRLYSLGLFRSSTYGEILGHELSWVTPTSLVCSEFLAWNKDSNQKLLHMHSNKDCNSLRYPIYLVQEFEDKSVVATTWMEDEELGRGYLLISTSLGNGKVFRWEAGGGPIAIGRTLHLQDSGCRSNNYQQCIVDVVGKTHKGSGGITIDTLHSEALPMLLIAEYGEGRVVRLEENGARTPLIIETSASSDDVAGEYRRLSRPFRLLVTAYGDLMVIDDATTRGKGFLLWRLPKASDVPGLPSLAVSRKAHAWTRNNSTDFPHILFESSEMGGMVLEPSGQRIYVTTMEPNSSAVKVVSLPLLEDLDDPKSSEFEKEGDEEHCTGKHNSTDEINICKAKEGRSRTLRSHQSRLVFDYTDHAESPGAIEVDNNGNLYLAVKDGILVVSKSKSFVTKISFSKGEKIVDLTIGSDNFLYIAMESKLARLRVPNYPLEIKKDLLIKA